MVIRAALALQEAEHRIKVSLQIADIAHGIVDDLLVRLVGGIVELAHTVAGEVILVFRDTLQYVRIILCHFICLLSEFHGADVGIDRLQLTHFFAVISISGL